MRKELFYFLLITGLILGVRSTAQISLQLKNYGRLVGIFDGRTPCQGLLEHLDIKRSAECIKIKWRLALFNDSISGKPGLYQLWGFTFRNDGPLTGKWSIEKGTASDPGASVYRLDIEGQLPLYFQKVDDNILYFLSQKKKLLIGNRDFSYALNRVNKQL